MDGHFVLCDDDHCPFRMYITQNQSVSLRGSDASEITDNVQTCCKIEEKRFAPLRNMQTYTYIQQQTDTMNEK